MYTRETQKLIYWLIADFSNFWSGRALGSTPTEYELYKVVHDRDICPFLIACANCMYTSDNIKKMRYWEEK